MSRVAANSPALPHLSPCGFSAAFESRTTCRIGSELPSFCGVDSGSNPAAIEANFPSQRADENFALVCVYRYVSRFLLGHCFGAKPAPGGTALFCFGYAALWITVSVPDPP
jgi:hypothetical protein